VTHPGIKALLPALKQNKKNPNKEWRYDLLIGCGAILFCSGRRFAKRDALPSKLPSQLRVNRPGKRAPTIAAVCLSKVAGHRKVERLLRWGFSGYGDGDS
jgi:hypothetical protein